MTTRFVTEIPGYPTPHSPYSHAVVANGFVVVSGQISLRPGGGPTEVAGTTMREQTRQCLRNVELILRAAGSYLDYVVKITVLRARPDLYGEINEAYAEFFPGPKPARAMARLGAEIPRVRVAIEALATVAEAGQIVRASRKPLRPRIPTRIGELIEAVYSAFDRRAFLRDALAGYEALEVLLASLAAPGQVRGADLGTFLYLQAQDQLTQRFTAEFSIRPLLERHFEATLARLRVWARDPSLHVRRLVSEGTRPRLPWAPRLCAFQRDPAPVLELLELPKDDPELYVRRSVANNLNDVGKDHPALLAKVARRWRKGADPERAWVVRHALRSALKRGEAGTLAVLDFGAAALVAVSKACIRPNRARIGGAVTLSFTLANTTAQKQRVLLDFRVFFVKATGQAQGVQAQNRRIGPRRGAGPEQADLPGRDKHPQILPRRAPDRGAAQRRGPAAGVLSGAALIGNASRPREALMSESPTPVSRPKT